ncbi:MAG: two-component system response regulator [Rhodospirillaceae bacterium]|jgi:two-component system chemotaxis response regulator CheY|nr:two-component system response regulator [Rhodospirillaceae bacterium]
MPVDTNMAILVVDDYRHMRGVARKLLSQIGFNNVAEASDGSMALRKLKGGDFGLVISDWNMAPMSGIELLKAVRADDKLRRLPFIMISAENKTENVLEARAAGVDSYILKPFNAQTLKTKIQSVLGDF